MLPPSPPGPRVLAAPCKWSFSCCSTLRSPSSPIHEEDEEKLSEDSDSQAVLSGGELVLRETSSPEVSVCSAGTASGMWDVPPERPLLRDKSLGCFIYP